MRFTRLTSNGSGTTGRTRKQGFHPVVEELEPRVVLSANPVYTELTGASSPVNGFDVGTYSVPTLGDLDGDGDLDLIVGEENGQLFYFENTGTTTNPTFTQRTGAANPLNGLDVGTYSAPAFGDLDGDGDLDLVSGTQPGTLLYFSNTGTTSSPAFTQQTGAANPFNGLDVGNFSIPTFGDIDGDGDLDLVSGDTVGRLHYFENTGTSASPVFVERTLAANPFNGFDVGAAGSTPSLGDVDKDGDLDLVVGEGSGVQFYFQNTGTTTTPAFAQQTGTANPFNGFDVGSFSAPAFGDLNGDGGLDLVSGNAVGSFSYYQSGAGLAVTPTSLNLGTTPVGTAGTTHTFTVAGVALQGVITLTAPTGVELSNDGGTTWQTSFTLTPTGTTVADTTISARISATASPGSVSGNISVSSTNATTQNVAVSGTASSSATVSVAVSPASVSEANRTITYTFTRSGSTAATLNVTFSVGGTSTFGTDYTQSGATSFSTTSGSIDFGIGSSTATLTLTSSPDGSIEGEETVLITVLAGTGVVADPMNGSATATIDDTAPVATFGSPSATITTTSNVTFTLTISDTNFDTSSLVLGDLSLVRTGTADGTLGLSGSSGSYTVTVSGITGDGTLAVRLADQSISDLVGNLNTPAVTSSTFTADNTAPVATFGQPSATITVTSNVTFTLTISDTNFDTSSLVLGDLSLVRTGTADGTLGLSGSSGSYTVTVSGITGDGTLAVRLADQSISDLVGNLNTPAVTSSTFTVRWRNVQIAQPGPTPTYTGDANEDYVRDLYRTLLGRTTEQGGLDHWSASLDSGSMTHQQVVDAIFESAEQRQRQAGWLYTHLLGRTGEEAGLSAAANALMSGMSEEDLATAFLLSDEFQQAHASDADFVSALYQTVLSRSGELSGMTGWVNFLSGGGSRRDVVLGFLRSSELAQTCVQNLYDAFLGRAGDQDGLDYWANVYLSGRGDSTVARDFLYSTEFIHKPR